MAKHTVANKVKTKRKQAAIDALDDYYKTMRGFSTPMARMLRRLSIAQKRANKALAKVNTAYGLEMSLNSDELRQIVPIEEFTTNRDWAYKEALRLILSIRSLP